MSREGYSDYVPSAPPLNAPQLEKSNQCDILYINSYPNNYIYHNKIKINEEIRIQKEIKKLENEIKQEKEKKSFWKKLCLCFSCIFCCCIII
jgi:hypothetical protein